MYQAGAGQVGNYADCSFETQGVGRFKPGEGTQPHIGSAGKPEKVTEVRVELLVPQTKERAVLSALRRAHPYEEVAYYLSPLSNENQDVGAGVIGTLPKAMEPQDFLGYLKEHMQAAAVRHTTPPTGTIKTVAVCGGAGSFLLAEAMRQQADAFVSADFKYHEFFDAEGKILVCDIGHYESEQFTKALLQEVLSEKFTTFACHFSETVTNPISYF
jgi:hypothetical protein